MENTTSGEMTPQAVKEMKDAIDNNQQDSPSLNLDPKNNRMFVVGDPNNTHPTKGEYKITYEYTPDMVNEEDKKNLEYDEERGVYLATVTYTNKRVKPLYRTKVTTMLLNLMAEIGVLTENGYTSEMITSETGLIFVNQTEQILELASLVLGESKEHLEYATELYSFVTQLMQNEPNILQETQNFLASLKRRQNTQSNKTTVTPTTQN